MTNQERQIKYLSNPANRARKKSRDKTRKRSRVAQGLCPHCGKAEPIPGKRYCEQCRLSFLQYHKERRDQRIAGDLCAGCGREKPLEVARHGGKHTLCRICLFKKFAHDHLGSAKHWQLLADKLVAQGGRCAYTGTLLVLGENASVDHVLPLHHFPHLKHRLSNLEWVCLEVNEMKRDRTPEEFLALIKSIIEYRFQALTSPAAECVA